MRPVFADDGSANKRASSKENDVDKPKRSLTAVKLIWAPPGARLLVGGNRIELFVRKGPVHLRQITSIQHVIARHFLETWLHAARTPMVGPVAPAAFPLFFSSCRRSPGQAVLCASRVRASPV